MEEESFHLFQRGPSFGLYVFEYTINKGLFVSKIHNLVLTMLVHV